MRSILNRKNDFEILPDKIYEKKDLAQYFKCSKKTIERILKSDNPIPNIKLAGTIKFKGQWIIDWIEANKNENIVEDE